MTVTPTYDKAQIDDLCRTYLSDSFNAASCARVRFDHVPTYTLDWANLDNEGFYKNARFYGLHCLVSGKMQPDERGYVAAHLNLAHYGQGFRFAALQYATPQGHHHDLRLREVLAFARDWRAKQAGAYSEPRLIEMPALKMMALWLEGPKDVFIPVLDFHTKLGDPIAVDPAYMPKVRAKHAELQALYKDAHPEAGGGLAPPGG